MIKFNIITLLPEIYDIYLNFSIFKKGKEKKIFDYYLINLREFGIGKYKKVDDYPYGGGKGLILRCEPIAEALKCIGNKGKVLYFSPKGKLLNNQMVKEYAQIDFITIINGRYEGIDQRIIDLYVDDEISIGDFVLSGSELASLIFIDAVLRHRKSFLSEETLKEESFENNLLEYPQYTRPEIFEGVRVPEVLLSGHHENIKKWRLKKSIEITKNRRPDLYKKYLEGKNEYT